MTNQDFKCPLCQQLGGLFYFVDSVREYQVCQNCHLIFVPRNQLISQKKEKERYSLHECDQGYDHYINHIAVQIDKELEPNLKGLDFGCGQTKILESKLNGLGHQVSSYDLFFFPDETLFEEKYDFLILSEVIEHLRDPREVLIKLKDIMKPKGKIFIKTKFHPNDVQKFENWFYKRDITHIQFFSLNTFEWIRKDYGFDSFKNLGNDLFLLS